MEKGGTVYINKDYIYTAIICIVVTALCCYAAYRVRGYMAFGGEWFVWLPVAALGIAEEEE